MVAWEYLGKTIQKHPNRTAGRFCNLLKQQKENQKHRNKLLMMESSYLHLFLQNGVYINYWGSDQPVLDKNIISVKTFQLAVTKLWVRRSGLFQNSMHPWLEDFFFFLPAWGGTASNEEHNSSWKFSNRQFQVCSKVRIVCCTPTSSTNIWLPFEGVNDATWQSNLANQWGPNKRESVLPFCLISVFACCSSICLFIQIGLPIWIKIMV